MANIKLRSPYYIQHTEPLSSQIVSGTLELTLNSASSPQYTLSKDAVKIGSNYGVLFDISELSRDYLYITFDGSYTNQKTDIDATIKLYNTGGSLSSSQTVTHDGFDGWSEFIDGVNVTMNTLSLAQSNTTIYVPNGVSGVIPFFDAGVGNLSYATFNTTDTTKTVVGTVITIERICDPKYTPIKVTFINAYGAFQDIWFDKKNVEELVIKRDLFKGSIISSSGTYSTTNHSKKTLDVIGNETITMNTGFVDENMNQVIKELLLSEQVWSTIDGTVYPMNVDESSHTYKTSINDKLINHNIKFSYAFDLINNIR